MAGQKKEKQGTVQSLEQSMKQLDEILEQLGDRSLSLEQSFACYKQGMDLLAKCYQAVDQVEKKLIVLEENGVEEHVSE